MRGLFILCGAALVLSGCAAPIRPATIYQGECRLFDDPGFRVRGATTRDKRWIATTQEKGIQVCGWQRPPNLPEPATLAMDCATVLQVVGMFGGDVARAEAYAVSQGASPENIATARQCLAQPAAAKTKKTFRPKRVFFSRPAEAVPLPAPAPAPMAFPSPISPAHASPAVPAAQLPAVKPTRWQRTKKRVKGWFRRRDR